ncbi:arabinosylfuranosidase ArfA [Phytohabitans sp. LJ34]|uniref:arabinosylfuranosidase ArfA n=1 Tax=Phytohabitans sp. LJ34 TaxID=3452217 RepID=UPI003F8ADC0E
MTVKILIDSEHHRGEVDPRLFGSFVEHMGRCVYTGIYEPDHPSADPHGFRGDVGALVRELGTTLVRYPGGNFVSGYRWEDGIGPRADRPRRLDLAWRGIETNQVGTDEFLGWAERAAVTPMMAVNLGTRGIQAAADLVEYCNLPGGTHWSDLRHRHGREEPYGVPLWCLGNEMDGPWQTGHLTAERYGELAAQAGRAMKLVDPSIELVACGSSSHTMPTFGYWETEVLERAWDVVDHISMHAYYEEHDGDRRSFLASGVDMDQFIRGVAATVDAVAARKHSGKRIGISFDEWNVWYQSRFEAAGLPDIDVAGPRIEDTYSALDAVVVGDLLISLLNHADRVRIACLAQLVNVIAPIRTDPGGAAWRQTTFHPVAAVAATARGHSLVTRVTAPELYTRRYGDVPAVAAAAVADPATGRVTAYLTNRGDEPATVEVRYRGPGTLSAESGRVLVADQKGPRDREAAAGFGFTTLPVSAGTDPHTVTTTLPPESWTVLAAR